MNKDSPTVYLELGYSKIVMSYQDKLYNKIVTEEKSILSNQEENNLFLDYEKNKIENTIYELEKKK